MSQSLQMRATSLSASALVLGAALVAALSARYALPIESAFTDAPIFDALRPPEPPPVITPPKISLPPPLRQPTQLVGPIALPAPIEIVANVGPTEMGQAILASVSNPDWVRRPRDLERYYPRRARQLGVEGQVVLECRVGLAGELGCLVVAETPPNWGFGQAALRIAGEHRMRPAMREGIPVEGRYVMRVPFTLE